MVIFGRGGRRTVWGHRIASTTLETGHFRCPSDQNVQTYRLVEARQMRTAFSIPIRDLGVLNVYLQCDSCNSTYQLDDVLATTGSSQQVMSTSTSGTRRGWDDFIRSATEIT